MNDTLITWVQSYENPHTRVAYRQAWAGLFDHSQKSDPFAITKDDVKGWAEEMRKNASARTVRLRLSAVSVFFTVNGMGNGSNPTSGAIRPNIPQEEDRLDAQKVRQILDIIPQTTVRGLHDYALFLAYARTGASVHAWRWSGFRVDGQMVRYLQRAKNGVKSWQILPNDVWVALTTYLRYAERLSGIGFDEHIFTAGYGALSYQELSRRLTRYANLAGIAGKFRPLDFRKVHLRPSGQLLALGSLPAKRRNPRLHGIGRRSKI